MESLIFFLLAMGLFTLPLMLFAAFYYLVIYLIYRKYKRNGGIYGFQKFISRRGLEL